MNDGAAMDTEGVSFEQLFRGLQETIARLEQGGLPLEEAIDTFERGMELANRCATILDAAELRVTRLLEAQSLGPDEPAF
jgi:exodeoxyribonuclease VII small subunit